MCSFKINHASKTVDRGRATQVPPPHPYVPRERERCIKCIPSHIKNTDQKKKIPLSKRREPSAGGNNGRDQNKDPVAEAMRVEARSAKKWSTAAIMHSLRQRTSRTVNTCNNGRHEIIPIELQHCRPRLRSTRLPPKQKQNQPKQQDAGRPMREHKRQQELARSRHQRGNGRGNAHLAFGNERYNKANSYAAEQTACQ